MALTTPEGWRRGCGCSAVTRSRLVPVVHGRRCGEGGQFVEAQFLVAVSLHQPGANRAKLEMLLDRGRSDAEPRRDVLGSHAFLAAQLGERIELVGGCIVERMTFWARLISWALCAVSSKGDTRHQR